jgi:dihydroneopterin aldolase
MSYITISELEVYYRVGITDEERSKPQRLLLTVQMKFDFTSAAISGRIERSVDYAEVLKLLQKLGEGRNWKLIESVARDIAERILAEFPVENVTIEIKKFPFPEAQHVSVLLTRERTSPKFVKRAWWSWEWR